MRRDTNKDWCSYCGGNHLTKYCPKTWEGSTNLLHRRCEYCGKKDHPTEDCPKTA